MRWLAKAAIQGALSVVPQGHRVNYLLQTKVSRRLPREPEDFDAHAVTAAEHLAAFEAVRPGMDRASLRCYEIGAGWDLIGPLSMWSLDVDHQTILDIKPYLKLDLINCSVQRFAAERKHMGEVLRAPLRAMDPSPVCSTDDLAERFGILYMAPADARSVALPDASFDLMSSTYTLEHIPRPEIVAIMREAVRLLGPDGIVSSLIDMQDHYNYTDPSVSVYNYLRYSARAWWWLNPGLQWQNRLRHPEYVRLFADAGYEILSDVPKLPSEEDLRELGQMRTAPRFAAFTPTELGTRSTHLVARPAGAS